MAGFDLIVTEGGDVQAIDLNFRQNGSTSMLMFHDALGKPINKFSSIHHKAHNRMIISIKQLRNI